ncbi:cobalt ECF transporter T component CbiQ [Geitlerinema sp. PCC 9228]|jgi:cobalt/nickel transport system permease protein|uniref:cobalt ECF transporter T component CbiQ n=1 Tax=Geitlerinema sp. PCC 9228 TaxID=111611 RepID=UPI0008F9CD83|nr:cobalt ECF transporter T component CbiQ [Geitlerinema sp. PCC 9228]
MKLGLDDYAFLNSPVHQWEPRYKLVALLALIFAFAFVEDIRLVVPMLLVTGILVFCSQLPLSFIWRRLRYPGLVLVGMVALLPWVAGDTVLWQWGFLKFRLEGWLSLLLIASRFLAIVITSIVLLGSMPFLTTIQTLRSLGLPAILADMMLLSYRYLSELGDTLHAMNRAMHLRGFGHNSGSFFFLPNFKEMRMLASLAGTLLVRSYEQAEQVYKAMRLRGYGCGGSVSPSRFAKQHGNQGNWGSAIALAMTLLVALGFVVAQIQLSGVE